MKKAISGMLHMGQTSWYIFIRSIQLACFMLFCAVLLLLRSGGSMLESYELYMSAMSLNETAQALLIISVLVSALLDELQAQ